MSSPYATYAGKTYLKSVILAQANAALEAGQEFILPEGIVFECKRPLKGHGSESTLANLYVVVQHLPFLGRFLVERYDGEGGPVHALSSAVRRVIEIPDECPPVPYWTPAEADPVVVLPRPWK